MIDIDNVGAIDVYTHADISVSGELDPVTREIFDAAASYFGAPAEEPNAHQVAAYYRERNMTAVIFPVDPEAGTGQAPVPVSRGPGDRCPADVLTRS